MTRNEKSVNARINRLLSAAEHLDTAAGDLAEGLGLPAGAVKDLAERAKTVRREARTLATSVNPAFWDAWRETFADLAKEGR